MAIQSDLAGASQKATALKNATDKLIQQSNINSDTQTTVVGNDNAQEAITTAQETATKIAQAVFLASSNLQSVAKDFEALDQTVANTIFKPLGGLGK
ncbi:type VII secretion effector [Enterococcus plantarum]|uniref:TIGR04197 family type VII secretion effector n=1 Tax=Enterococcus plantarum TaxID=1077675 RepID=UPI00084D0C6A|nr:TIGR04197 family type VII secretion effector [Enterococcus plantarum]OEG13396.1 type VII secretion effector [Enterococcus plantarum]